MPARLIESLATTEALAEVFSDESVLRAMLRFEVALARAEAKLGIVPQAAADAIADAAVTPLPARNSFTASAILSVVGLF